MTMLRWIYTDELEFREDDVFLTELMKLANRFQLQLLRERQVTADIFKHLRWWWLSFNYASSGKTAASANVNNFARCSFKGDGGERICYLPCFVLSCS